MDLVTVTCWQDHGQMFLQAESIEKFVEPCTHWVIINDDEKTLKKTLRFWKSFLPLFYTKHKLKIIVPKEIPFFRGWERQQVLKFWIYQQIQNDYLILDSKNFFVRPCSTDLWKNTLGSGGLEDYFEVWKSTTELYSIDLNQPILSRGYWVKTPFVFRSNTLNKLGEINDFCKKWRELHEEKHINRSEFLYYSYLERDRIQATNSYASNIWDYSDKSFEHFFNQYQNEDVKVFGIHRRVLEKIPKPKKAVLPIFLRSIGLEKTLHMLK